MSAAASSAPVVSILVPVELQEALTAFVAAYQGLPRDFRTAPQLIEVEQQVAAATDRLGASTLQTLVQEVIQSREAPRRRGQSCVPDWLQRLVGLPKGFKNQGRRRVMVRLARGAAIPLRVRYYSRNCDRDRAGPCRGCYPALACLGIFDRCSPLLASHAALCVALCGSFAEAEQMLRLQGATLDGKTLRDLVYRLAARARRNLQRAQYQLPGQASVQGLRLVVALDGGRVRLRQPKRGRRRRSGRHGYRTPWREPKLLTIYALDEQGKKLKEFRPIVDGTLELLADSEEIFTRLKGYLAALRAREAREVVFVGDGAPWVSNRVPQLRQELNLREEQVRVVVDFYHAVGHLKAVADMQKKWPAAQRQAWLRQQRRRLYRGAVAQVVAAIDQLRGGRHSKELQTERAYFANRQQEMNYAAFRRARVPSGSGAVESAMRRIVNLRLKGAGIFWLQHHAEHVLLLRCYAKAGRWANLLPLALCSDLVPITTIR